MYKYDVALSYEAKSEAFVKEVTDYLRGQGLEVFFAPYCKEKLLSHNLKSTLFQVYQNESLIKVLFVTEEYLKSEYTRLEARRSISSTKDENSRLIVINFLGASIPDDLKPYVYLDGDISTDEIAYLIGYRVKELKSAAKGEKMESDAQGIGVKNINYITNNTGTVLGNHMKIGNITINK